MITYDKTRPQTPQRTGPTYIFKCFPSVCWAWGIRRASSFEGVPFPAHAVLPLRQEGRMDAARAMWHWVGRRVHLLPSSGAGRGLPCSSSPGLAGRLDPAGRKGGRVLRLLAGPPSRRGRGDKGHEHFGSSLGLAHPSLAISFLCSRSKLWEGWATDAAVPPQLRSPAAAVQCREGLS